MKDHILKLRNQIYYEVWEKYKNRISMEELAVFFNISLKSLYRIIAEQNKYPTKKKPTLKQIKKVEDLINKA